jgi:hypothetical protein
VIDRGVVRFDYPSHWIVQPDDSAMHLHDQAPSVESCDLGVSIFRVPMAAARDLDLDHMLRESLEKDRKAYETSEIRHISRAGLDISWLEQKYIDPDHKRDARFRVALARETAICLISMNYWAAKAETLEPVWDEVLASLTIGMAITDPTLGPVVQ